MADTGKVAKNLRAFQMALNAHDRENPTHTAWGIGLAHFDMERLGFDEGEEILPGQLAQALEIINGGGDVDYVGGTSVELVGPGESAGTFRTDTPLFGVVLVGTVLIVGALLFMPVAVLGPVAEHLASR